MTKVKGLNLCNATCGVGRRMAKTVAPVKVSRLDREFLENGSKKLTKLFAAIFFLFLIGVGNVWGTDPTWTWTAGSASDFGTSTSGNVTLNGKTWSVTRSDATNESSLNNSCVQLGAKSRPQTITLSTSAFSSYKVTKVEVECSSYGGNHSVAISVGGTSYLAATATPSWTTIDTKYGTGSSTGNIEIAFTKNSSARALYIKSITVTYTSADCETLSAPGSPSSTAHATSVDLSWNSVANSSGYLVTFGGTEYNIASGTTTKTITGLKKEKTYAWTVAAKGDGTTYCALGTATSEQSVTTLDGCTDNKVTYTVASTSSVTPTDAPDGTSATFSNTYTSNKYQMTSGNSQTLTLTGYAGKKIKGVTLDMHSNGSAGAGTFSMVIGSTTVASIASATNFNEWYDNDSYGTDFRKVHVTLSDEVTVGTGESIVITIAATTNSIYCQGFALCYSSCIALAPIKGSVNWSNGTKATLIWDALSNVDATTPYTVTYKTGSNPYGSSNVSGIRDTLSTKKYCTITSLTAGNSYDFKLEIIAASSTYCDKDTVMTSQAPKITATTDANLVEATYAEGSGPSTNASYFTFSGVGLTGDVTVTAPTNFLVSKTSSSSGFGSSVTVSPSIGSITNQKIWICLASGLTNASSPYGGNVALSGGGAATVNVAVNGSVTAACTAPTVATPTLTSITSGTITVSCASVTVGTNCDVTDYGYVWNESSDPTISDHKTSLGTSTPASAFSDGLSISFTTGNTYKIKAYAINSAGTTLSSSLTVTPQKVTFNSNGGSEVDDKYVNKDAKVTAPSDPTKSGYDFDSWRTTSGLTTEMNFNGAITKDTTLYAKWNPASYDVTLKANGGSSADQVVSATYTQAMPTTVKAGTDIVAPTYNGYTFAGYYDNADYTLGTQYYTDALASAHNWDKASTANLYGRWIPNEYVVTLDANGGVDGATTSVNTTFGQAMPTIATANLPTREGYRFDGFYTSTDTKYYNADGTSAKNQARYSDNQVLYAHWKALTYFSVNGTIDGTLTRDDGAAMPSADVPTACGDCWAFLGWSEDSEESSAIDYASGDTHTFGTPTTLYAVFGQVEYKMINSTSGLVANDNYVIASSSDLALSNADHSYYSTDAASSDISSISRVNAGSISVYNPTSNIIWKFTGTYSSGQLYNTAASKYVNLDAAKVLDASSQNLTFSVNDDGETWTIKSSTPKYLHGYVDGNGDGFESLTSYYWDEDEDFSAYILHQTSSTVTTTPNCLTYAIVWKVGNDDASGSPTEETTTCTGIEDLPTNPDDDALDDCATKFMGWSESVLVGDGHDKPGDLFTTEGGAPKIDEDKTFHAVFATASIGESTSTLSQTYNTVTLGSNYTNDGSDDFTLTDSEGTDISMERSNMIEGSYSSNHYIQIKNADGAGFWNDTPIPGAITNITVQAYSANSFKLYVGTSKKGTTKEKTIASTTEQSFDFDAKDGLNYFYFASNSTTGQITSYTITYKAIEYSDYTTLCCDNNITIGTPSITGEGTVTFTLGGEDLDPGDDVETCTSAKDVVATVTPAAGYSCTAVSFSGGSVSVDPTPGAGNYPAAPSTQDYTLSFAKETTSATLSTSATFTAKPLTAWAWKYKKGNVGSADPATAIPDVVEAYIGEYVRFVIDGYTPSDVIAAKQGYVYDQDADPKQPVYNTDSLAHVGHSTDYYTTRGKVAGTATLKFKAVGDASITKTMTILTKALPNVTFVDNVHNKTDFTNWGTDGVVSSTVTTGVVTHTKPAPSHSDISDPGSNYNTCERNHVHLVGWIRSDWADEHPGATHSQITSVGNDDAGNPYYYAAGADVDIEAQNGKTFYAVWSKIE